MIGKHYIGTNTLGCAHTQGELCVCGRSKRYANLNTSNTLKYFKLIYINTITACTHHHEHNTTSPSHAQHHNHNIMRTPIDSTMHTRRGSRRTYTGGAGAHTQGEQAHTQGEHAHTHRGSKLTHRGSKRTGTCKCIYTTRIIRQYFRISVHNKAVAASSTWQRECQSHGIIY